MTSVGAEGSRTRGGLPSSNILWIASSTYVVVISKLLFHVLILFLIITGRQAGRQGSTPPQFPNELTR